MILDNVERYSDVEEYLPTEPIESQGSVIVTTRYLDQAHHFGNCRKLVEKLGEKEARALFLHLNFRKKDEAAPTEETTMESPVLPEKEEEALKFLLGELDGLALGIHQMAALIKNRRPSLTRDLAKFVELYKINLSQMVNKDAGIKGHQLTTLWAMTFNTVRDDEDNPGAWTMLGILCCLQPDRIPLELFSNLENLDPSLSSGNLSYFCGPRSNYK